MKKMRTMISAIVMCSIIIFSNTVYSNDIAVAKASSSIRLSDSAFKMELGRYSTLKVYGTKSKASWKSSNTWVATVNSSGKVTAKAVGTATITATVNGKKLTSKVSVLRIKSKILSLVTGQSNTITVSGTNSQVTWSTSDSSIVTVSDTGNVTAVAPGVAYVTASVDGKNLTSTVSVIDISDKEAVMEIGGFSGYSKTLKVNNTTSKVTWSTSDPTVATVSSLGVVSAKSVGSVTITASVDGATFTSDIKVLGLNTRAFTLKMGETNKLEILGTNDEVIWASNKHSVAVVDSDGTVSTIAPGTATIIANVDGRNVKATVTVVE